MRPRLVLNLDRSIQVVKKKCTLRKDQVMCLLDLISKNKCATSNGTKATINKLKHAAWQKIAQEFSLIVGQERRRRPKQLQLKWSYLKKAATKRNAMYEDNVTDFQPDEILDTVNSILIAACSNSTDEEGGCAVSKEQTFSVAKPDTESSMKSNPLNKDQVKCLIDLISKHKCLMLKCKKAEVNQLKSKAWKSVAQEFTALTGLKRNPEQLRKKWVNLKRPANKQDAVVMENNLNTSSTQMRPRLDETLDSVSHILEYSTSSGFTVDPLSDAAKKRTLPEDLQMARMDKELAMAAYFRAKTEKMKLESMKLKLEIKQINKHCCKCLQTFSE